MSQLNQWRVKIKKDESFPVGYEWELQRQTVDFGPLIGEWEFAASGESKTRKGAIENANHVRRAILNDERREAEAEYVPLD